MAATLNWYQRWDLKSERTTSSDRVCQMTRKYFLLKIFVQIWECYEPSHLSCEKADIHTFGFFSKGKKGKFPVPSSCKFSQWNNRNWYGLRMASDRKAPQPIVKTDPSIIGTQAAHLPSISDIGEVRCLHRAQTILKEPAQPQPACSPCCYLTRGTEVSTAAPPDYEQLLSSGWKTFLLLHSPS